MSVMLIMENAYRAMIFMELLDKKVYSGYKKYLINLNTMKKGNIEQNQIGMKN